MWSVKAASEIVRSCFYEQMVSQHSFLGDLGESAYYDSLPDWLLSYLRYLSHSSLWLWAIHTSLTLLKLSQYVVVARSCGTNDCKQR